MTDAIIEKPLFQLKGSVFSVHVLEIQTREITQLIDQLREKIQVSPKYFEYAPLMVDLKSVAKHFNQQHLELLFEELQELNLLPVGLRCADTRLIQAAHGLGIAVFPVSQEGEETQPQIQRRQVQSEVQQPGVSPPHSIKAGLSADAPVQVIREAVKTMTITQPVRSGQQIYAQDADLIILSSVGAGAEILADGNIHIYGSLKGRALAGVQGDKDARIFCHSMEAELISIAGQYFVSEDLQPWRKQGVRVELSNDRLQINPL